MKDLIDEAYQLQTLIQNQGWDFCFIGGIAIQKWSEPRLTRDMDITLLTGFGGEEPFIDFLLSHYSPRREDARRFALLHRVLLIQTKSGVGIDVALGALPFEFQAVKRAKMLEYAPGISLLTCGPEDLVVMKAFASRPLDWIDIRGILVRQGTRRLDWDYITENLTPLCEAKEDPEIMTRLMALRSEVQRTEPAD